MNPSLRFVLLAALILSALVLNLTSAPETPATCTTDTDCMERFGGDGGPGR